MAKRQKDLPQRRQDKLADYLAATGSGYKKLSADTFVKDLRIAFAD